PNAEQACRQPVVAVPPCQNHSARTAPRQIEERRPGEAAPPPPLRASAQSPGRRRSDSGPRCRPCAGQCPSADCSRHNETESAWLLLAEEGRECRPGFPVL